MQKRPDPLPHLPRMWRATSTLRQHSRVDAEGVRAFVAETPLHPLSAREALKWLEKRKK